VAGRDTIKTAGFWLEELSKLGPILTFSAENNNISIFLGFQFRTSSSISSLKLSSSTKATLRLFLVEFLNT
jgi:hypothetical protein